MRAAPGGGPTQDRSRLGHPLPMGWARFTNRGRRNGGFSPERSTSEQGQLAIVTFVDGELLELLRGVGLRRGSAGPPPPRTSPRCPGRCRLPAPSPRPDQRGLPPRLRVQHLAARSGRRPPAQGHRPARHGPGRTRHPRTPTPAVAQQDQLGAGRPPLATALSSTLTGHAVPSPPPEGDACSWRPWITPSDAPKPVGPVDQTILSGSVPLPVSPSGHGRHEDRPLAVDGAAGEDTIPGRAGLPGRAHTGQRGASQAGRAGQSRRHGRGSARGSGAGRRGGPAARQPRQCRARRCVPDRSQPSTPAPRSLPGTRSPRPGCGPPPQT
jgi:hypothetical protein